MNNSIYIRRKSKLFIQPGTDSLPDDYIFNLLSNIQSLGHTFSPGLLDVIKTLPPERFKSFYKQLITDLKEMLGDSLEFKPMYPNFPEQVKKASARELYGNAFFHYLGDWIGQRILPGYEKEKRAPLQDTITLRVIDIGTKEDFNSIFTRLLNGKVAVSDTDKKDIEWFVKTYNRNVVNFLPADIPVKENAACLLGTLLVNNIDADELFSKYAKTATDVLRVATALSGGDISLAKNTKFTKVSKKNRKILLQCLGNCSNITEDMLRHKNRWKRLGEKLHPFEYKDRFPSCYAAFDIIRNDKPFSTFNSKIETALLKADIPVVLALLKTRPGELARRLDKLVRCGDDASNVLDVFGQVAGKISSPVLLQVRTHFAARNAPKEFRVFFPKGNVAKVKAIENTLPAIEESVCERIVAVCDAALINRFRSYKPLGKVYIEDQLKNYTVPFALRSASRALKTISRGSKIDLPAGDTIRFFIYWKDGHSRTDIDLSALALDENSGFKTVIAYYNLRDLGGCHSGDITSAPKGASEFIDITIPVCLARDIRYIIMSVNSYTRQPYYTLPVCFAGFMMRQFPNSGEIYEPLTVENKFDLTADTRIALPMIIDLQERKVIWTDLALKSNPQTNNNVHNNLSSLTIINKAMTTMVKPGLYDLLKLHIAARGEETSNIDEANTIFATGKGIKPTDIDIIISEYL